MAEKRLTKNQLEKLIRDGDASIRFVQKKLTSKSSECWQHFHLIHVNNQQQQYVSCNFCKKFQQFENAHKYQQEKANVVCVLIYDFFKRPRLFNLETTASW